MGQRLHSEKYWSIEIFTTNKVIHSILCCNCKWQLAKKLRMPMKFKWAKLLVFACYFKRARLETNDHCSTTWPQLIHTHNHVGKAKVCVSVFAGHATLSRACLLVGHIQYIPTAAARHALSSFYAGLAAEHQQSAYYWRFSTAWYGTVRHGSVRYSTAQFGSVAFPPQFSTAIEWAGLFTHRYNCAASTAVTSS